MEVVSAETAAAETPVVESQPETPIVTSGPRSPLAIIRQKRAEWNKDLFYDLAVPRRDEALGVTLWVRYKAVDPGVLVISTEKREKDHATKISQGQPNGDPDRIVKANADLLVNACMAIYTLPNDEQPPADPLPAADYPTFGSEELAQELGATSKLAVDTCRKLYATEGDLNAAAFQLQNWSAKFSAEADKSFLAG
jgi:hypothetical protein